MRSRWLVPLLLLSPASVMAEPAAHPVVIELFTSQGCSSCPPADALLESLADQPGILALSYHVSYWNSLGWIDPYSSDASTARQRGYAAARGNSSVYTPQLIVAGTRDVVGSREEDVRQAITQATTGGPWQTVALQENNGQLHIHIDASPQGAGELLLVGYQRRSETAVPRGENAGETLHHRNNVMEIRPLGHWDGQALDRQETMPTGDGAAVLLQTRAFGPMIGGGML